MLFKVKMRVALIFSLCEPYFMQSRRIWRGSSNISDRLPITKPLFLSFSSDGLYAFRAFLTSEFSEENIAFYLACEDFKKTKSAAKLPSKAERIYNEFIGTEAPREVSKLPLIYK